MSKLIAALEDLVDRFDHFAIADFKSVKKKFVDQDIEVGLVDEYLDTFKNLRNRITDLSHKNIDNWGKKPWEEFKEFIDKLKGTKSKSQEKKLEKIEGAELITENDDWFVYKIDTHKAAMIYGSGTKWCITEKNGEHWNSFAPRNNFYFLISKNRPKDDDFYKIALQIDRDGEITYWDTTDESWTDDDADGYNDLESSLPLFRIKKSFPKFKPKKPDKNKYKKLAIDLSNRINEYIETAEPSAWDLESSVMEVSTAEEFIWKPLEEEMNEDEEGMNESSLPPELDELRKLHGTLFDMKLIDTNFDNKHRAFIATLKVICEEPRGTYKPEYITISEYAPPYIRMTLPDDLSDELTKILEDDECEYLKIGGDLDSFDFDDKTFVYENDQKSHMAYVQLDPKLLKLKVTKFKTSLKVANEKDQVKIDKIALDSEHPMAQLIALQRTSNQKIFKKIAKEGSSKYALGVAYE